MMCCKQQHANSAAVSIGYILSLQAAPPLTWTLRRYLCCCECIRETNDLRTNQKLLCFLIHLRLSLLCSLVRSQLGVTDSFHTICNIFSWISQAVTFMGPSGDLCLFLSVGVFFVIDTLLNKSGANSKKWPSLVWKEKFVAFVSLMTAHYHEVHL